MEEHSEQMSTPWLMEAHVGSECGTASNKGNFNTATTLVLCSQTPSPFHFGGIIVCHATMEAGKGSGPCKTKPTHLHTTPTHTQYT